MKLSCRVSELDSKQALNDGLWMPLLAEGRKALEKPDRAGENQHLVAVPLELREQIVEDLPFSAKLRLVVEERRVRALGPVVGEGEAHVVAILLVLCRIVDLLCLVGVGERKMVGDLGEERDVLKDCDARVRRREEVRRRTTATHSSSPSPDSDTVRAGMGVPEGP